MLLSCTQCNTRYMVADDAIGAGGRTVRCAVCANEWYASLPAASSNINAAPPLQHEQAANPEPTPTQDTVAPSYSSNLPAVIPPPEPGSGLIGIVMAVLFVCLAGLYAVGDRDRIVKLWPPAVHAYDAVGLSANRPSLAFQNVQLDVQAAGSGADMLMVSGEVINPSKVTLIVPPLIVRLLDETGATIFSGDISAPSQSLAAGEIMPFRHAIFGPPEGAVKVDISLPR